jgi:triacylglycerol lipase
MYFPNGFDKDLAIELGNLLIESYEQFYAFEDEREWEISKQYELVDIFRYKVKPDKILGMMKTWNFDNVIKNIKMRNRDLIYIPIGFIAKKGNSIYLVFRGTKTPKEWLNNFSISLNEYLIPSYGNIHEGFFEIYDYNKETINRVLSGIDSKTKVYVTGHSLGAALATLALPDIEISNNKKISSLYTFGSPRVGDNEFVKSFNNLFQGRSYRIVNTSDIVTSIPLPALMIGSLGGYFSHIDTPIDFTIQENNIEKNHAMETYIREIENTEPSNGMLRQIV